MNDELLPDNPRFEVLNRLGWIWGEFFRVKLNSKDKNIVKKLASKIYDDADSSKVEFKVREAVKRFLGCEYVFKAFLKKTKPSVVYIICSYGLEGFVSAAKELDVETVEFQHGVIGRGHLGYDFKAWENVPYFPEQILAFGPEWFKDTYFPRNSFINLIGYSYLEEKITEANRTVTRRPKQLLVLSQGPSTRHLLTDVVCRFAAVRTDWQVVLRPHPKEDPDGLYEHMKSIAATDNWRIEVELSLYEHIAASSAAFGINSTALAEALVAGCQVALLDTANTADYFDTLVSRGDAVYIKDGEGLARVIDNLPKADMRGYYASPVADVVAHVEG